MADEVLPVDFKDNGTVVFSVGDQTVKLRRPTFAEWQTFAESHDEITQDLADAQLEADLELDAMGDPENPVALALTSLANAAAVVTSNLSDPDDVAKVNAAVKALSGVSVSDPVVDPEERKQRRKVTRQRRELTTKLKAQSLEARIGWATEVVGTLGDVVLSEPEPWMGTFNFCQSLVNHWERVPLAVA